MTWFTALMIYTILSGRVFSDLRTIYTRPFWNAFWTSFVWPFVIAEICAKKIAMDAIAKDQNQ